MQKALYSIAFAALLFAAPAFASGLVDSHDTNYSQGQSQGQQQGQAQNAYGGSAKAYGGNAASKSSSYSGASAGAVNTTKQLNNQQLSSKNSAKQSQTATSGAAQGQGQSADNNGNSYTSDDDNKTEVYAVSYTDAAPNTVAASIGSGVVVTTWGVKVLGPVFGMTDQHVHYLPAAVVEKAELIQKASVNDETPLGRSQQSSYLAALCSTDEHAADLRFGDDACDRIGEIVDSTSLK